MINTIELRFANFPTRTPILIELKVQKDVTVRQLRAQINEVMRTDEHCLMRVFGRCLVEIQAGTGKRLSAIEASDEDESLLRLGIEDGDVVYLEGPLNSSAEGTGMAVAMLGEKVEQQSAEIKQLLEESKANRQVMQRVSEEIHTLRNESTKQNQKTDVVLTLMSAQDVNAVDKDGKSPLHHAAQDGSVAAMELLLSKGADAKAAMTKSVPAWLRMGPLTCAAISTVPLSTTWTARPATGPYWLLR